MREACTLAVVSAMKSLVAISRVGGTTGEQREHLALALG